MIPTIFWKRDYINIDLCTKCTLACSRCVRVYYDYIDDNIPGGEISLEDFEKLAKRFRRLSLCGQVSDPTMHSRFNDILKIGLQYDRSVIVHVAASHRPERWFEEAFKANPKARWVFGIDGLPQDSHKYRERQDGQKLFDIMCSARRAGMDVAWQYILFGYNEHTVEDARKLAADNDVELILVKSSRFSENDPLAPSSNNYVKRPRPELNDHVIKDYLIKYAESKMSQ